MKSFLISLFLTSVTLAESGSGPCIPTSLYRWRSKKLVFTPGFGYFKGAYDRIETTKQNLGIDGYEKERKIATICSNHAEGTVALYNEIHEQTGLHYSFTHLTGDPSVGILPVGYVYTDAKTAGSGSFKVYLKIVLLDMHYRAYNAFLTTENINEGADIPNHNPTILFYSLPKNLSPE